MTESTTSRHIQISTIKDRSLFPNLRAALTVAALLAATIGARAQAAPSAPDASAQTAASQAAASPPAATQTAATQAAAAPAKPGIALSNKKAPKVHKQKKDEKVVLSKDTRQEDKKAKKVNPIEVQDAKLPDKALYDKAEDAVKHGRYDVARLDLQTLLNTYPDSQYMMRAKLGVADSWFKEGGTAALTQAEQEYTDFITFFPNSPEAAEAQMRIGDIYFRQMDKPDRDYSNTTHAEATYRQMLQQFPDSTLVPQAKQRLREVQETLASREADIAAFYASHSNWSAVIARYQTVVDTYPLYSHMDDVLVGLGDAYEAEATITRSMKAPPGASKAQLEMFEAGKARLLKIYDDQAYAAYSKVVLEHSAAAHVEDARDRLVGMGLPIPTPTPDQVAASAALENSRGQYTLSNRVEFFVLHKADTVPAATLGDPPLEDAKPTLAPDVLRKSVSDYYAAMLPAANPPRTSAGAAPLVPSEPDSAATAPPPTAAAPLALQDVPAAGADAGSGSSAVLTSMPEASPAPTSGGTAMGIEIVQPSSGSPAPLATAPASPPVFPGSESPAPASVAPAQSEPASNSAHPNPNDNMGGIQPAGTTHAAITAPIEKPAAAPDAINEAVPGSQPPAQIAPASGKNPKPAFDKADESSSKHKKKKGLAKLNPF
jgi:outer membrane protein assembly factor BamD